jgi:hypothetical protein
MQLVERQEMRTISEHGMLSLTDSPQPHLQSMIQHVTEDRLDGTVAMDQMDQALTLVQTMMSNRHLVDRMGD